MRPGHITLRAVRPRAICPGLFAGRGRSGLGGPDEAANCQEQVNTSGEIFLEERRSGRSRDQSGDGPRARGDGAWSLDGIVLAEEVELFLEELGGGPVA